MTTRLSCTFAVPILIASVLGCNQSRDATTPVNQGIAFNNAGEYDKAIAKFSEAIRIDPNLAEAYYDRGLAWQRKGDQDKAINDYNEAIRINPNFAVFYQNRGAAWYRKNKYPEAIADLTAAIRLNSNDPDFYFLRGLAHSQTDELDKAISDFTDAVRLKPDYAAAHNNRGSIWSQKGEYQKATADFNDAIRLDPNSAFAYNARAWLLATCPDAKFRDGLKAYESAVRACELTGYKDAACLDTLAAAYAEAGDFENAVEWQTKALDLAAADLKQELSPRLELYRSGRPYREQPAQH